MMVLAPRGSSSTCENQRPTAGGVANVCNTPSLTSAVWTSSGCANPVTLAVRVAQTPIEAKLRLWSKNVKYMDGESSSPLLKFEKPAPGALSHSETNWSEPG